MLHALCDTANVLTHSPFGFCCLTSGKMPMSFLHIVLNCEVFLTIIFATSLALAMLDNLINTAVFKSFKSQKSLLFVISDISLDRMMMHLCVSGVSWSLTSLFIIFVWNEAYKISQQDKNIAACYSTVINATVLLIVFFVLLDVLCMLVRCILG